MQYLEGKGTVLLVIYAWNMGISATVRAGKYHGAATIWKSNEFAFL